MADNYDETLRTVQTLYFGIYQHRRQLPGF